MSLVLGGGSDSIIREWWMGRVWETGNGRREVSLLRLTSEFQNLVRWWD